MVKPSTALLHGTLETMILRVLAAERAHGYGIAKQIEDALAGAQTIEDGSLYPALYRLERRRLIHGDWGVSDAGRRARFYEITPSGRKELATRTDQWSAFAGGVSRLLLGKAAR